MAELLSLLFVKLIIKENIVGRKILNKEKIIKSSCRKGSSKFEFGSNFSV